MWNVKAKQMNMVKLNQSHRETDGCLEGDSWHGEKGKMGKRD